MENLLQADNEIRPKDIELELADDIQEFIAGYGLDSASRAYAVAMSPYLEERFEQLYNVEKLNSKELDDFKDEFGRSLPYEHARLFRDEDETRILVLQPYKINAEALKLYQTFASEHGFKIEITMDYSAWFPGKAISVIFTEK